MAIPAVVIAPDIIANGHPHYFPADKLLSMDTFSFQPMKETFCTGIVVTTAFGIYAATQVIPFQQ